MSRISKILESRKYLIEVATKDASRALDILNDDKNLKVRIVNSDVYVFEDESDFETALELFKKSNIEIYEPRGN